MAASARLTYSSQQSWNFSKISFCSSVKVFAKSSWCLAMYPSSSFISFELFLLSSCGMMFPCHSSFIILFIGCTSCQHTTISQKGDKVQTFFETISTFFAGLFLWLLHRKFCILSRGLVIVSNVCYTIGWKNDELLSRLGARVLVKIGSDHTFDHLQVRTTWTQCE